VVRSELGEVRKEVARLRGVVVGLQREREREMEREMLEGTLGEDGAKHGRGALATGLVGKARVDAAYSLERKSKA